MSNLRIYRYQYVYAIVDTYRNGSLQALQGNPRAPCIDKRVCGRKLPKGLYVLVLFAFLLERATAS